MKMQRFKNWWETLTKPRPEYTHVSSFLHGPLKLKTDEIKLIAEHHPAHPESVPLRCLKLKNGEGILLSAFERRNLHEILYDK